MTETTGKILGYSDVVQAGTIRAPSGDFLFVKADWQEDEKPAPGLDVTFKAERGNARQVRRA
jgi:hypothetical protein